MRGVTPTQRENVIEILYYAWMTTATTVKGPPPNEPAVLITGAPSALSAPDDAETCTELQLYAQSKTVTAATVSTSGLGDATITFAPCTAKAHARMIVLRVQVIDQAGTSLSLRVPRAAFPSAGTTAGKLIVASPAGTVEQPIALIAPSPSRFITAFLWGVGIAIPALLSAFVSYRLYASQKELDARRAEQLAFDTFKRTSAATVGQFFTVTFPLMWTYRDRNFFFDLSGEEKNFGFEKLPGALRMQLDDAMRRRDRKGVVAAFRAAFPEYGTEIDQTVSGKGRDG